jgi:hypothetical protein
MGGKYILPDPAMLAQILPDNPLPQCGKGGVRHACPMPSNGTRMPQEQRGGEVRWTYCQREQWAHVATSRAKLLGQGCAILGYGDMDGRDGKDGAG